MKKEEYLAQLGALLAGHLPEKQVDGILDYYESYFREVGPEQEASLIEELGTPEELAARILDRPVYGAHPHPSDHADGWATAPPASRPAPPFFGALVLIFVAVLLLLIAIGLGIGLGFGGVICVGTGAGLTLGGIFAGGWFTSLPLRLLAGGGGLFAIGFGLLLIAGGIGAFRGCWRSALRLFDRARGGDGV